MTAQNKIIIILLCLISFILGVSLDRIFKNLSYLQLDPKVSVVDITSLLVTIFIALLIPFYINKLIDDKRGIKMCLIDEFKELIEIMAQIKAIISDSYSRGSFENKDRDNINYLFHSAELKINSVIEQMSITFKDEAVATKQALTALFDPYKDYLTGGELMISSFNKIDDRFYRENNTKYSKIETGIKVLIQKVYKI